MPTGGCIDIAGLDEQECILDNILKSWHLRLLALLKILKEVSAQVSSSLP